MLLLDGLVSLDGRRSARAERAALPRSGGLVVAKVTASFVGFVAALQIAVQEGAELPDADPVVEANPDMFDKAPPKKRTRASAPKERATRRKT